MPGFDELLHSNQAETLMKNSEKLGSLMEQPETQKLFSLLNQNAGGNLEQAAGSAANGDTAQLMDAIKQLMQNPEAVQLIHRMKTKLK